MSNWFESADEFEEMQDRNAVSCNSSFTVLIEQLKALRHFFDDLSSLFSGREMYITHNGILVEPTVILLSVTKTLASTIAVCELGNIADAYCLLRKARDNLYFYLYVAAVSAERDPEKNALREKNIEAWSHNKLRKLEISEILKYLASLSQLEQAIDKFDMRKAFDSIRDKLNNFVHGNGIDFCNKPLHVYHDQTIEKICSNFGLEARYIAISFLFLLVLLNGSLISSNDYIDALECGLTPEDGSQYWVAPFVADFIKQNKSLLGTGCEEFLDENSYMYFRSGE